MNSPRATARLQVHGDFTLHDAKAQVSYYASLGISHLYLSPITRARPGSTHGYDVVDHTMVNPELGGEAALKALSAELRRHGMGLVLDIVPNHMATHSTNAWWWDVLTYGPDSAHAAWFDIDWHPKNANLRNKVLAPFLAEPYGKSLSSGSIKLVFDEETQSFQIDACGARYPVSPDTLRVAGLDRHVATRHYDGTEPDGRLRLHELLERQHYRLAWWRCAADCINWRRFFEVSELIGVSVERPEVFEAVHALPLRLYAEGVVDGLRIDHVDGLAEPIAYCRKLRAEMETRRSARPEGLRDDDPWLLVEKILAPGEEMEDRWQVDGTSGYDFMDQVGAVLHDASGAQSLTEEWRRVAQDERDVEEYLYEARRLMLERHFVAERRSLLCRLSSLAQAGIDTRDWTTEALGRVLDELLIVFPVYRSYTGSQGRSEHDSQLFSGVIADVRDRLKLNAEAAEWEMLDWLDQCLGGKAGSADPIPGVPQSDLQPAVVKRFQQLTPPLAAKSLEDTTFYRYGRLLSRNEVGSDPGIFSSSPDEFHRRNTERSRHERRAMLATATHDHKRGEDARARLAVISEIPALWVEASERWMHWPDSGFPLRGATHTAERYMLLQALAGAWPMQMDSDDAAEVKTYLERVGAWQTKALREGKLNSGWFEPNLAHEQEAQDFLNSLAPGEANHGLLRDLGEFVRAIAPAGALNSLSQTILRVASPGVPDQYQGTELWDFSLVDPDNRRPVDFQLRREILTALDEGLSMNALLAGWKDGRIKQAVLTRALRLRSELAKVFAEGDYLALPIEGPRQDHVLAFMRSQGDQHVLVIVPRLCWSGAHATAEGGALGIAPAFWGETRVSVPQHFSGKTWRDALDGSVHGGMSGNSLGLADVLAGLPVAMLVPGQG